MYTKAGQLLITVGCLETMVASPSFQKLLVLWAETRVCMHADSRSISQLNLDSFMNP